MRQFSGGTSFLGSPIPPPRLPGADIQVRGSNIGSGGGRCRFQRMTRIAWTVRAVYRKHDTAVSLEKVLFEAALNVHISRPPIPRIERNKQWLLQYRYMFQEALQSPSVTICKLGCRVAGTSGMLNIYRVDTEQTSRKPECGQQKQKNRYHSGRIE